MDEFDVKRIALEAAASLRPVNTEALISAAKEIEKFLLPTGSSAADPSGRVQQVAELLRAGFTQKQIAEKLGISPTTVALYRRKIGFGQSRVLSEKTKESLRVRAANMRAARAKNAAARPAAASAQ